MESSFKLPKCALLTCPHEADPRWWACDVNDHPVMICDGHFREPKPSEVMVSMKVMPRARACKEV